MPTTRPAITGEEFIRIAARKLEPSGYSLLSKPVLRIAGLFNRPILELSRMTYQNDRDYLFDSTKFERRFNVTPTSYKEGIEETLRFCAAQAGREQAAQRPTP